MFPAGICRSISEVASYRRTCPMGLKALDLSGTMHQPQANKRQYNIFLMLTLNSKASAGRVFLYAKPYMSAEHHYRFTAAECTIFITIMPVIKRCYPSAVGISTWALASIFTRRTPPPTR